MQNLCMDAFGKAQHVNRAMHAGLCRLHWIALVMNRRCGTGQIVDLVDFDIERKCHVVAYQFKSLTVEQMLNVAARAAKEIIDANYIRPLQ